MAEKMKKNNFHKTKEEDNIICIFPAFYNDKKKVDLKDKKNIGRNKKEMIIIIKIIILTYIFIVKEIWRFHRLIITLIIYGILNNIK